MTVDMRVRLGSLELANPVVTASGTFASGREYADFTDLGRLGAIVTKGVSLEPWAGNASPRIAETASGML
ncbi:MAG: dihydroorotate dehydrogenase, partial [Actinobacteria bacterium]